MYKFQLLYVTNSFVNVMYTIGLSQVQAISFVLLRLLQLE